MRHLVLVAFLAAAGCGSPAAPPPVPAAPAVAAPQPAAQSDPASRVESPPYTRWVKFPVGTTVVIEEVTDVAGSKTTTSSTYKLTEKSDAVAVVETGGAIIMPDGTKQENPPQALRHTRWMAKGKTDPNQPLGTYATGTETITVRGKEYKTTWYKARGHVEAGETDTHTWMCDDVPGAVVKAVHRIPGAKKTVTAELVTVRTP